MNAVALVNHLLEADAKSFMAATMNAYREQLLQLAPATAQPYLQNATVQELEAFTDEGRSAAIDIVPRHQALVIPVEVSYQFGDEEEELEWQLLSYYSEFEIQDRRLLVHVLSGSRDFDPEIVGSAFWGTLDHEQLVHAYSYERFERSRIDYARAVTEGMRDTLGLYPGGRAEADQFVNGPHRVRTGSPIVPNPR